MTTFFTADTHFGHAAIIRHCQRPFADVAAMDEAMVERWNATVRPKDEVWHLGDFAVRIEPDVLQRLFARLHGRKRLIVGNHDGADTLGLPWAEPAIQIACIRLERRRLVLCHYGLRVWPGQHGGAIHLYGHSHGRLPGNARALDVGVDCWDYAPVGLERIETRLAKLPAHVHPEVARSSTN